jgi:hypothetical protein
LDTPIIRIVNPEKDRFTFPATHYDSLFIESLPRWIMVKIGIRQMKSCRFAEID